MKNCIIWTRVSTKYQEKNGASLADQKCKCELFAKQNGYKIKGYFGGAHETAKTPGPMLKEMYSVLKKGRVNQQVQHYGIFLKKRHCPKFCVNGNRIQL